MKNNFVPYNIALEMKSIGLDEPCLGYYNSINKYFFQESSYGNFEGYYKYRVAAPLYQQAFSFFREKYGYDVSIGKQTKSIYQFVISSRDFEDYYYFIDFPFTTYEEAEIACINKLIKITRNKSWIKISVKNV